MTSIPFPQFEGSPRTTTAERVLAAGANEIYEAWTSRIDRWFAQPGTVSMLHEEGRAWFFYNRDDWGRHPHYGRFLRLVPDRLIETTWITGNGLNEGTCGAETVLRIELTPSGSETRLVLTHLGFSSDESCKAHAENWPLALDELAKALSAREIEFR